MRKIDSDTTITKRICLHIKNPDDYDMIRNILHNNGYKAIGIEVLNAKPLENAYEVQVIVDERDVEEETLHFRYQTKPDWLLHDKICTNREEGIKFIEWLESDPNVVKWW